MQRGCNAPCASSDQSVQFWTALCLACHTKARCDFHGRCGIPASLGDGKRQRCMLTQLLRPQLLTDVVISSLLTKKLVFSKEEEPHRFQNLITSTLTRDSTRDQFLGPMSRRSRSFFILEMEIVQLCSSPVLPHEISASAQNCAGFEAKQKSKSSWTHSNPCTWKRCRFLKWKRLASAGPRLGEGLN